MGELLTGINNEADAAQRLNVAAQVGPGVVGLEVAPPAAIDELPVEDVTHGSQRSWQDGGGPGKFAE